MKKTQVLAAAMPLIFIFGAAAYANAPDAVAPDAPPAAAQQEQQMAKEEKPVLVSDTEEALSEGASQSSNEDIAVALQEQIQNVRKAAELAGAGELYPNQFELAASAAQSSRERFNAGEADASIAEGTRAHSLFRLLKKLADANNLRNVILEYNFDAEEPQIFADAEAKQAEAIANFDSNPSHANEVSRQALEAYQIVCNIGFMGIAEEEHARAIDAMSLCDSIMAARSMEKSYQAGFNALNSADKISKRGAWEDASKGYRDSAAMFSDAYQSALYKKNIADEAMRVARARQEASSALAFEADKIAPLTDEDAPSPQIEPASPPSKEESAEAESGEDIQY